MRLPLRELLIGEGASDLVRLLQKREEELDAARARVRQLEETLDARERFLEMEGKVLFLRRAGKIRIGYLTDLSSILNPDPSSEGPRFNIFLARDCNQFAEYTDQVIFPKRGGESGKLNICLHELGTEIYLQHSD